MKRIIFLLSSLAALVLARHIHRIGRVRDY
jgi:hypothetical protein